MRRQQWDAPGTASKFGVEAEQLQVLASMTQLQHLDVWLQAQAEPTGAPLLRPLPSLLLLLRPWPTVPLPGPALLRPSPPHTCRSYAMRPR
jgi:hypothetical protein